MSHLVEIVLDCRHPSRLARFWQAALGWRIRPYDQDEVARLAALGRTPETDPTVAIDSPDGSLVLFLQEVPEPRTGKNRMHVDVQLRDQAHLEELLRLGATVVSEHDGWRVLADPEGNELCAQHPAEPAPARQGGTPGWEQRIAEAWASIDEYEGREDQFRELIDSLAAELPDDDPIAAFERASAWDSTGHPDRAVALYRNAIENGLAGYRRRRAVIQMASSLRNTGQVEPAIRVLEAERALDPSAVDEPSRTLDDAISATLALCLVDAGREREAVSVALAALAPHLPRYQRSMSNYARLLLE